MVESLSSMYEDLGAILGTAKRKGQLIMNTPSVYTWNPSTVEAEPEAPQFKADLGYIARLSQKKKKKDKHTKTSSNNNNKKPSKQPNKITDRMDREERRYKQ